MAPNLTTKKSPEKTAQDWVRQLRFSNDVNISTVGVDTDRVTPQLMLASSNKLLGISRGEQQGDAKDSLRYQKVFGPVEYFAQRIQKDGGSVARSMLWKATNRGNVDFINTGSLQPHINAVFHESNLSQFVDNSTPLDSIDNSMKVTRVGQGGIQDGSEAPIEMRLVQPSYYGYISGTRTAQKSPGLTGYLTKNVMRGTDGKLYQNMLNVRTGKIEPVDSQKAASSVVTTNEYMDTDDQFVYAMGGPKGVRVVAKKDVDYILPHSDDAESTMANNVPMYSGVKAMRLLMGCHHPQTPIIVLNDSGETQIVPAKRLGYMDAISVIGCDDQGHEAVFHVRKVIPRSVQKNTRFVKVILSSGRVLTTSPCHKWYVYDKEFKQIPASELSKGMLVPRSLFTSVPTKNGIVYTRRVTKQVASLMGRIAASGTATATGFKFDYACSKILHVDQKQQLTEAMDYLGIANYHFFSKHGVYSVTIKDPVFMDWVQENLGLTPDTKRIPGCLLSLSPGFTSYFLDSYCKTMTNLAQDRQGDNWLLDISSASLRDSLAFMLNKIYTDTKYRDCRKNGQIQRALQLVPINRDLADVALDSIIDIQFVQPPAMMIDIDCDDNVYAAANGIITHNSKYSTQAIPLQNREAPLVRALDQQSGEDMPTILGRMLGTQWAPKPGMVKAVRKDRIDMLYDDGTKGSVYLYQNFPANAKGWLSNYVKVKAGDKVAKGQLLASSNYTDDNGVAALGRNLRIGYMSYHGGTYEDACTLSESAAKKMAYTVMYKTGMDKDKNIRTAKSLYNTWKPGQYSKEQLDNLDDDGVVKVGTVLQPGDPMILGIRTTEASPGTLGKRILSDVTETWQHHSPGVVTDVINSKSGIKVYATISKPLEVGDKISGAHGNKATCAQIIPDDKMPRDSKGRPLDILFDPLGIISRCYDDQTEFLTQDGWKFGQDVLDTDTLMCYDTVTGETYQTAQEDSFYRTQYNGHLIGAKAKGIDFLVTPKHRMFVFKPDTGWYETTAEEAYGTQVSIPTGSKDQDIVTVEPQDWYEQPYADMVYCPTVATGYVVTRRNGAIVCLANTNPAQMMQVALGKVAQKTGKPYVVPSFMPKGQSRLQWVKQEMKKHNVKPTQDIYDPQSGRTVKNVFTGSMYFYPLKHLAQSKMSARGTDEYTSEGVPQRGSYSGCFPSGQKILTIHGEKQIGTICQKRIPQYVTSWSEKRKEWVWRPITDWFTYRAKVEDVLCIFTENAISTFGGRMSVKHTNASYPTKNHKMYMADGSIKLAGEIKVGDLLAGIGCQYTQDQMQALLGTLMGDSCRCSKGGIQCMHSRKQFEYLNYKRSIFASVGASRSSKPYNVSSFGWQAKGEQNKTVYSAVWLRIPRSYYTQKALQLTTDSFGKRHLTIPVLEAMGQFGFCMWFLDDGSIHDHRKKKTGKPQPQASIATHGFSFEEVQAAAVWLQKWFGLPGSTRIYRAAGLNGQLQPVLHFHRDASWQIARIMAKHIPWNVIPKSKAWLRKYCEQVQKATPCVKHDFCSPLGIVPIKVKSITPYRPHHPGVTEINVYDFTVDETHNYCLSGGIKVSNSKSIGSLESSALAGHDAFDFITQDAKLIRGQANSDFWRSIRTGEIPVVPGQPLVHRKFFAHLQGSGLNVKRSKQGISLFALSNKDVNQLAGNRELKSTDTYEQKTFREIDGGLFGKDVFGPQGNNWGYIQLDSPLPNPVMQQPLARLLRMSDAQFQAVVQGKEQVNGIGNATEMKQALQKLDLQKEADRALTQLKDARPSKRDAALKRYVAIARMRDNGVRPQQYMLDRIPVLPPKFRPISQHSDLTMVADSNYLYAQLLNARDDLREAKSAGLPDQYLKDAQANIYRRWKELTGLYDPSDVKLKAKNVGGLLKWALGKSPKFSAFQRKVLGSVVDTVGRGVVVPSTKVKLNEIGMPVEMAWDVYAPFVTRKLVQRNYTPIEAMKMVKSRSRAAFDALQEAVAERPVVMNRAPSLHKLSLMGFNVKLTSGNAIKVNPSIVVPFGMDFDGDSCKSLIVIWLQQKQGSQAAKKIYRGSQNWHLTNEKYGVYYLHNNKEPQLQNQQQKEGNTMVSKNEKVSVMPYLMELSEVPVIKGSEVAKSPTVTEWDVEEGTFVNTIDPATGEIVFAPMTKVSRHTNLKMFDVKFGISGAYEHMSTVSEDHSLITYNSTSMELEKTRPEEALGACVPMTRFNWCNKVNDEQGCATHINFPSGNYSLSYDMGVFFGLMVGDGWVSSTSANTKSAHIACCEESLQNYILELTKSASMPFTKQAALFNYAADEQRFSQRDKQRFTIYMDNEDKAFLEKLIGHGAENKHIPYKSFMGSIAHMIGVLMGLLATDGAVSHTPGSGNRKSAKKAIIYHTVSPTLRDGVQDLACRLGIKTSVTTYTGTSSGNTAYAIVFSLEDFARLYDKNPTRCVIPVSYKQEALMRIVNDVHENNKASCKTAVTSYDIVPFPRGLFCEFSWAKIVDISRDSVISARSKGFIKRSVAKRIADALERRDWSIYKDPAYLKKADQTHRTPSQAKALVDKWIAMVRNEDIGWEVVTDVTPSTCTEGWDCTVPGPYTFSLSTGTVVQDTVNLHVPVSQAGIRDVRQKMMPQRNLIGIRKKKILYAPQKAYTQGLYVATRMGESKDVKVFDTLQDAKNAYRQGTIDVDTPIIIKDRK